MLQIEYIAIYLFIFVYFFILVFFFLKFFWALSVGANPICMLVETFHEALDRMY